MSLDEDSGAISFHTMTSQQRVESDGGVSAVAVSQVTSSHSGQRVSATQTMSSSGEREQLD